MGTANDFVKPEFFTILISLSTRRFPTIAVTNLIIRAYIEFHRLKKLNNQKAKEKLEEIVFLEKMKEIMRKWNEISPEEMEERKRELTEFIAELIRMRQEKSD